LWAGIPLIIICILNLFAFEKNVVLLGMESAAQKSVSRETSDISKLLSLLREDKSVHSSISFLKHRNSLALNTNNPGFVLFWLRLLYEEGYFPLVVFKTEREAESFYSDVLGLFDPDSVSWIPLFSGGPVMHENAALENHISRFLDDYYANKVSVMISSDKVFDQVVPDKASLRNNLLHIRVGGDINYSRLPNILADMGYQRSGMSEYCGEFSVRGGIVDIYPFGETYPLRIDLFGDTVESIRRFNPNDQNSFEDLDYSTVRPASFSKYSKSTIRQILPSNTVVVYIDNGLKSETASCYNASIPFKQVFFRPAEPGADVHFSIADIDLPVKEHRDRFYQKLKERQAHIFVFAEHDIVLSFFKEHLGHHAIYYPLNIKAGFQYKPLGLIVLSGREMFHKEHYVNPNSRFIPERSSRIENIDSLEYGQAVVHVDYGIGIYRGIELLEFKGVEQESMIVEYRNKDRVFVPVRYMNKIFKYSGEKPASIHLDQIGTSRWEQAKTSTKNYLKKAAYDLLTLYRDRKKLQGYSYEPDTPDTLKLEADFPYDETPDQKLAISDISKDMEDNKIMDRLVCGDVGFGKTEVAIRAAFKAVYSGKQVAVLVPTTMLCFQHYESFKERLSSFGINVDYVNRFVSGKVLTRRLDNVKSGMTDILVGTHKLLSNNLFFKDLGLLIIDEEHRFGVNHKEKIQNLKRRVDVLTLTATPIPRTLQLSLVGLRDITKIDTPPKERLPIATKVIYWNDEDIKLAIERELERNGQVFILHNVIEEQPALRNKIERMFPDIGVRTAHGKLAGPELERTMLDFYHHKFDVLITTTIIESGIDVPNANTLIVMNAHNFGLSQLYQIRGRVGRSYKKAYAYLVLPRGKHINPTALKRLQTLEYYTDLGSGYQIAMRDLEIRGAGSLFGVEQSGHINRVGYAYFNQLFGEAVESIKSGVDSSQKSQSPDLYLEQSAYLPETYIENKDIRISFYRKISTVISSSEDYPSAVKELDRLSWSCRDRFGNMPEEAKNLFNESRLAVWLKQYNIESLSLKEDSVVAVFQNNLPLAELREVAGRFLYRLNEKGVSVEFISKKQLSAKIGKNFIDMFFRGNF